MERREKTDITTELAALREDVRQLALALLHESKTTSSLLRKWDAIGMPLERQEVVPVLRPAPTSSEVSVRLGQKLDAMIARQKARSQPSSSPS